MGSADPRIGSIRPDAYSTFLPLLTAVMQQTSGPVLELGVGFYSTPLLHALCAPRPQRYADALADTLIELIAGPQAAGRRLTSVESGVEWGEAFRERYEQPWHSFILGPFPESVPSEVDEPFSVVFVDHAPPWRGAIMDRMEAVHRLLPRSPLAYYVLHDSEPENQALYGYDFRPFSFVHHFACEWGPWATVLSNAPPLVDLPTR